MPFLGMAGRYKQPVRYGREYAHKSRAATALSSLGDYYTCEIHHINKEENVLISETRKESAVGDSAEPRQ
jgi:hypothetical protein